VKEKQIKEKSDALTAITAEKVKIEEELKKVKDELEVKDKQMI
jgi:hypothetical protein